MKKKFYIEKETVIRQAKGDEMRTTIYRLIIADGKNRAVVMTPAQFKDLKKQIDEFYKDLSPKK
jgi:hypothetical protein